MELDPGRIAAYLDLIEGCGFLGQLDDAREIAALASSRFPDRPEIPTQLGAMFATAGHLDEAERFFEAALRIVPDFPLALYNLARIADARWQRGKALALYKRARALDREHKLPPVNIGDLELAAGFVEAAIASHEAWLAKHPNDEVVLSAWLLATQYQPGITAARLLKTHALWDERIGRSLRPNPEQHLVTQDESRQLRVGLVSGDLREHPVGFNTIPVIEALRSSDIQFVAYSDSNSGDVIAARFRANMCRWHDTIQWPHERLAAQVRHDRIDILIDLAGHTSPSRLNVFARRPAPIQITWAGYPSTTGLSAMDVLIADRFHVPPGEEDCYVERVARLPEAYICFDPPEDAPAVGPLPGGDGSPLAFSSFHNPAKVNRDVVGLWSRILRAQKMATIRFIYTCYEMPEVQARIRSWFAEEGIPSERLVFEGRIPRKELLQRYGEIDIALDTFPYSGCTTTCEALWMGVPVVTLPGETFVGRHSQSHLSAVGLTEMIARDADDYAAIIERLAADRKRLAAMRSCLRERMRKSPLCDAKRFADDFRKILRGLWLEYCGMVRSGGTR